MSFFINDMKKIVSSTKTECMTIAAVCAASTLLSGAVAIFFYKKQNQIKPKHAEDNTSVSHELTDVDTLFYKFDVAPITSLTWFKGNVQEARISLEKRMKQIMAKNPWLYGRISTSGCLKKTYRITYTRSSSSTNASNDNDTYSNSDADMINDHVKEQLNAINAIDSPISRDMPIATQNSTLLKSSIYISHIFLRNNPTEPFFKATLVPCATNPKEAFALIVQLSHAVGDGATYYKLLHMLCSMDTTDVDDPTSTSDSIVKLNPERIQNTIETQIDAMGKAEHGFLTSIGFVCRTIFGTIKNVMKGPSPIHYNFVNRRRMQDEMQMENVKTLHARAADLPFVSTNDVLTSWLLRRAHATRGLMAVNWRNRLEGHTPLHAGNYENVILYEEQDYATPGLIRKSLGLGSRSYKRLVTKEMFPSFWNVVRTKFSVVTNWSTFAMPNVIEGCAEDLHFPLVLPDAVPFPMFIIFRAGVGNLGLCYAPDAISGDARDPFAGIADFLVEENEHESE